MAGTNPTPNSPWAGQWELSTVQGVPVGETPYWPNLTWTKADGPLRGGALLLNESSRAVDGTLVHPSFADFQLCDTPTPQWVASQNFGCSGDIAQGTWEDGSPCNQSFYLRLTYPFLSNVLMTCGEHKLIIHWLLQTEVTEEGGAHSLREGPLAELVFVRPPGYPIQ
jgi:hypothetical protein